MRGMSDGGSCRSASIVTTASPRARRMPAVIAAWCPKLREKKTTLAHGDRKSTRLNSSHSQISYAGFCFKKKSSRTNIVSANAAQGGRRRAHADTCHQISLANHQQRVVSRDRLAGNHHGLRRLRHKVAKD